MPKLAATDADVSVANDFLKQRKLSHLHVKERAATLALDAGPADDPWPRAASACSPSSAGLSTSLTRRALGIHPF
jgi:hypothetical protein